jgi:signal transduction histidine kinase/ActR/RegA family two-component response regulator
VTAEPLAVDVWLVLRVASGVAFAALAVIAALAASRSGRGVWWVAGAFGSLALVLLRAPLLDAFGVESPSTLRKASVALLLGFPYLLLRFTGSFRRLPRWLEVSSSLAVATIMVATALLPTLPSEGVLPRWALIYVAAGLAYWVLVSSVTVVRLWRAGRGQPTLARRRMRLMSGATTVLALMLFLVALNLTGDYVVVDAFVQLAVLASAVAFALGFSPPRGLAMSWARPEYERLQKGTAAVLQATTAADVARELLPPTAGIVGGAGAALVDRDGTVVASYGVAPPAGTRFSVDDPGEAPPEVVSLAEGQGDLVVWTSPYTPFFGREEVSLLQAMGAVAGLALQRSALLDEERQRRIVLAETQQEAERARHEATQANLAKTEFLSRMSHELRTPLNAILGFGQLLELSTLADEDEEAVSHILKAGRHLLALINDVLDLSRIEAGQLAISPEPVHAAELVDDAVALIRLAAEARSIRLIADVEACDEYVRTDRQRCRQVLLNLLSNAIKYNYDGGEVRIGCARADGEALRLSVTDTGPGIDAARQERLFEPFDRLGAESSGVEGTGLGLALSKQLVRVMGGEIGVRSTPGDGSTFWIDLPITEEPADAIHHPMEPEEELSSDRSRTMLLVEDNLANLRLVEAMLRRRPEVSVIPAMQGRLAIDLARQRQPDIIVLDLHLPDLSGQEVLHRLKADPRTRHIPVVIASADANPGPIRRLQEDGAFTYLTKPLELQPFLDMVDAALVQSETSHRSDTKDGN